MKRIREIIKEELTDDFSWAKNINPIQIGELFSEKDICFDSNDECEININKENITFVLEWNNWLEFVDFPSDDEWFVESLIYNGTNYDGGGDHYELELDEFNYSGHKMSNEQAERFQNILNILTNGEENLNDYRNHSMLVIKDFLKYNPLEFYFDTLVDEYLDEIGYTIQKNRWLSLGRQFDEEIKKSGSSWNINDGMLKIRIPLNLVWGWYDGSQTLSDLLLKVSKPISNENWGDLFYQEFDTTGGDIEVIFENFLDSVEKFLENEEEVKWWEEHYNFLNKLKLTPVESSLNNTYKKKNPNNSVWYITLNYRTKMAKLELYKDILHRYGSPPINIFNVSFNEIPQYLEKYDLK